MTNIVLLLAALLFAFGVLVGSVLHTRAIHREYQRIAERVRELRQLHQVGTKRVPGPSHSDLPE